MFGGVYSPSLPAALLGRGQLVQDQGRRTRSRRSTRNTTLVNCVVNERSRGLCAGHPGQRRADRNLGAAAEYRGDQDQGHRRQPRLSAASRPAFGKFGFTWNNTFLRNYDVIVPGPAGPEDQPRRHRAGRPVQAFPKWKSIGIIDWDLANFGATLTGRYVPSSRNARRQREDQFDVLHRSPAALDAPSFADNFGFALGVNNLFDKKAPGCLSCESNNFAATVHDVPGRYLYARATHQDVSAGITRPTARAAGLVPPPFPYRHVA